MEITFADMFTFAITGNIPDKPCETIYLLTADEDTSKMIIGLFESRTDVWKAADANNGDKNLIYNEVLVTVD